jgi:hypothetical protein
MSMPVEAPTRPTVTEEELEETRAKRAEALAKQEQAIAEALSPFVKQETKNRAATDILEADQSEFHSGIVYEGETDASLDHLWLDYDLYVDPNVAHKTVIQEFDEKRDKDLDLRENSVQMSFDENQETVYELPYMPNLVPEEWPHVSYELKETDTEIMIGTLRAILPTEKHLELHVTRTAEDSYAVEMLDLKERGEYQVRLNGYLQPLEGTDGKMRYKPNQEVKLVPNAEAQTFRSLELMHTVFQSGDIVHSRTPAY